jgi:hypothetical protein
VQWRPAFIVFDIDVQSSFQHDADTAGMLDSEMQRSLSFYISGLQMGASTDECCQSIFIARPRRVMQRRVTVGGSKVDVRSILKQKLDHLGVPQSTSRMERRVV